MGKCIVMRCARYVNVGLIHMRLNSGDDSALVADSEKLCRLVSEFRKV